MKEAKAKATRLARKDSMGITFCLPWVPRLGIRATRGLTDTKQHEFLPKDVLRIAPMKSTKQIVKRVEGHPKRVRPCRRHLNDQKSCNLVFHCKTHRSIWCAFAQNRPCPSNYLLYLFPRARRTVVSQLGHASPMRRDDESRQA